MHSLDSNKDVSNRSSIQKLEAHPLHAGCSTIIYVYPFSQQQHKGLGLSTLSLLLLLLLLGSNCRAAKILVLFPHASESHFAVMRTLVAELAGREHNVTVYGGHGLGERLERVAETVVAPEYDFWSNLQQHAAAGGSLEDLARLSDSRLRSSLAQIGAQAMDHFLAQPSLQALLQLPSAEFDFDVIIVDYFYTEALLALGYKHNKPTIGIVSTDFGNYMNAVQEALVPVACSPIDFEAYTPELGFAARLANIRECISRRKQFHKEHYAAQEKLIRKHFKIAANVPELQAQHLALLLLNTHVPLWTPRPLVQQIVPAGGLHIRGPRELPWNVKRYAEESRDGIIYVQLGNEQLCGQLPKEKLRILFEFIGGRKERFIWTCHDVTTLEGLPKNVMIQHGVPQIDILAHPRVRAFIMNGDLLSLQEGIMRHVPMLGLPSFQNECKNMQLAVSLGVGLQLEQSNFTKAALSWALDELTTQQDYQLAIREVSSEFRDRPLGALANAMFWVNYVVRHKGGAAIRTRGIDIGSNHLHLFDLFVFYFALAIVICAVLVAVYFGVVYALQRKRNDAKLSKLS
ncbi:UDP-glucuronosyltransferase 1-7C isoform X1 [Drosophila novamexicana]|uniref:UDP-glucuronosyltransferase 1-7C isoform X1 n=1 Tax=Drosophila novamexicana TaxID=47314 RepID=UPI0011E5BFB2|nr:UDP-glucuronosyltransferase 1-7C isoform X1 [Drosophila novamexicana]